MRITSAVLAFANLLLAGTVVSAQDPNYTTTAVSVSGAPGDTIMIDVYLDIAPGATPVQGFSYSFLNEDGLLNAVGASQGAALIENGGASWFQEALFSGPGGGLCLAVVFDFLGGWALGEGSHHIVTLTFEVSPMAVPGTSSAITFCHCLNDPPISSIVVAAGQSIVPILVSATVDIEDTIAFRRADPNASGTTDIADAIYTLDHLFQSGPAVCLAAMDSNDDDSVDLGDALFVLSYINGTGPPPPAPFDSCGGDSELTCEEYGACP